MKLKNKFSLILASSLVALSSISCENKNFSNLLNETKNKENIDFSSKAVGSDILKDDDVKCKDEANLGFKTKALDDLPPPPPEANLSNGSAGPSISFADQPPPAPPAYSTELPVPENLTEGSITLIFKDEFKIRIKKEDSHDESDKSDEDKEKKTEDNDKDEKNEDKKFETKSNNDNETEDNNNGKNDVVKFKSLIQENGKNENEPLEKQVEKLNKLMKEFNIKVSDVSTSSMTEKDASNIEQSSGSSYPEYDVSNMLSMYSIKVTNKDIKNLVNKLRAINLVRESNFNYPATSDFTPNDSIFNNNENVSLSLDGATVTTTTNKSDESLRYWYSRIDAYRAWDIVRAKGIIPAKVAVIDQGFIMNHDDSPNYDYSIAMRCSITDCECNNPNICSTPLNVNNLKYDTDPSKTNLALQHGEFVASVIGSPINSFGVSGLAVNSDITRKFVIPIKSPLFDIGSNVSIGSKGDVFAIRKIIAYNNLNPSDPIRVINMSRSRNAKPIDSDTNTRLAIQDAYNAGILTVITAGNDGTKIVSPTYSIPGNKSAALIVGGTAKFTNTRWSSSRYDEAVDISAPSEGIILPFQNPSNNLNTFVSQEGTSFSAPMVASLASLLMGKNSRADLNALTKDSVDKVKDLIVYSSTLIQTDYRMGYFPEKNFVTNTVKNRVGNGVPNGRLLNMYNALRLSFAMENSPNKGYLRIFNTDAISQHYTNGQTNYTRTFFKEDKLYDFPIPSQINLDTYNASCVYSWGYQVWRNGKILAESTQGIAGKRKPLRYNDGSYNEIANNVFYNWIYNGNGGTSNMSLDSGGQKYILN
ncbi:MAG: S8 family serine peptidase [Cyanobacteriota bacterium]